MNIISPQTPKNKFKGLAGKSLSDRPDQKEKGVPMNTHVRKILVQAAVQVAQILMERWINTKERRTSK
jgi:hypothetical protein